MNLSIIRNNKKYEFNTHSIEYKEIEYNHKKYFNFVIDDNHKCTKRDYIEYKCDKCNTVEIIKIENYKCKKNKNLCKSCSLSLEQHLNSKSRIEKMKKTIGYNSNSQRNEVRNKISKTKRMFSKQKNIEIFLKKENNFYRKYQKTISQNMRDKFVLKYGVENPSQVEKFNKKIQTSLKKRYEKGDIQFGGGRCKWIQYNSRLVFGNFELKVAKWLDSKNINWISHKGIKSIKYLDKNNEEKYYFPDFYDIDNDIYYEPHAKYYWNEEFEYKIKQCQKQYKIIAFDEDDFKILQKEI